MRLARSALTAVALLACAAPVASAQPDTLVATSGGSEYTPSSPAAPGDHGGAGQTPTGASQTPRSAVPRVSDPLLAAPSRHPLRRGAHGALVLTLQRDLTLAGYAVPQIGAFGALTQQRLQRFQRDHRLAATGRLDHATAVSLANAAAARATNSQPRDAGWVFPLAPVSLVQPPAQWDFHGGVDIAAVGQRCGAGVDELAIATGTVVREGVHGFGPFAPVLRIDGGPYAGRYVYYGHAALVRVRVGAHVSAGQPIAQVGCGRVGFSAVPHLEIGLSAPGGPPCCPRPGQTTAEVFAQLVNAYGRARQLSGR